MSPATAGTWPSRPPSSGSAVRRVELTASDGVRLVSWAMPADSGSGYWLLICHGNAGNISEADGRTTTRASGRWG